MATEPATEAKKLLHIYQVRGRPVGLIEERFGHSWRAIERGDFPVSPTGFWSLSGRDVHDPENPKWARMLEDRAKEHEKERSGLIRRLEAARKVTERDGIGQYIHATLAAEKALQDGFFASDRDRQALWAGAYQLYYLVESDARFQPKPDKTHHVWTKAHCEWCVVEAKKMVALLQTLAAGNVPVKMPIKLLGTRAYLELPPKPNGEPKIALGNFTPELGMKIKAQPRRIERRAESAVERPAATVPSITATQMDLF